ncbi:hypothetical protein D3C87_82740 [compost metagenome]
MKKLLLICSFVSLILLSACGGETPSYVNQGEVKTDTLKMVSYVEKIPGKLYFIPHERETVDFPIKYNSFIEDHTDLKIITVFPVGDEDMYNTDVGYFVFTEEK